MSTYAIQYLISDKEYSKLLERVNERLRARLPKPERVQASTCRGQKYVRQHVRLFLKVWAVLAAINQIGRVTPAKQPLGIPAKQIGTSITAISGIYRLAFLILTRVKNSLRHENSKLGSGVPVLSGLIAGTAFTLFPKQAGRSAVGLYVASKAAEFVYNHAEDLGYLNFKPQWLGSWALFPISMAQLFHTFIFHPECCPSTFKRLMMRFSEGYIPTAPVGAVNWPSADQIVESIADISILHYPKFSSPVLYPNSLEKLDVKLSVVEPVIATAHPAISTLTSAVTHPGQPSELSAFGNLVMRKFASASRYVLALYVIAGLMSRRDVKVLYPAIGKTIRTSLFLVMSAATCWGGINFSQSVLGRNVLPLYRYKLIGAVAGLWALLDMHSRARYMYVARMAITSWWSVLEKKGKVKSWKHGDVALFAVSFSVIMTLMERAPTAVSGAGMRKCLNWVKTGDFTDTVLKDEGVELNK